MQYFQDNYDQYKNSFQSNYGVEYRTQQQQQPTHGARYRHAYGNSFESAAMPNAGGSYYDMNQGSSRDYL